MGDRPMVRLEVLCFAGTYGLALASDLARFVVRNRTRWYTTVALTAIGWLVQGAYLGNLAWKAGALPIASVFGSLLVLAWILAAIDLYLVVRSPGASAVGLFLMPVVLALIVVADRTAPRADWTSLGGWRTVWGTVHGVLLLLGAVCSCVAFAAGAMYLAQADRLRRKRPPRLGFTLPSLEQSERWNRGAISLAFPLLTFGLAIGVALVASTANGAVRPVLRWTDPKIVSALAMWLAFAVLVHARYRDEWRGKKVMLLTVVAFAFLVFSVVGVDLVLPTAHGTPPPATAGGGRSP